MSFITLLLAGDSQILSDSELIDTSPSLGPTLNYKLSSLFIGWKTLLCYTSLMVVFWSATVRTCDFNYFRSIYEWPLKKRSLVTH